MQRISRYLTLRHVVLALTLSAVFAMALRTPLDTDMWWHLRAGEWEVTYRAILRVDLFSHTRAGVPWLNVYWLSQALLFGAYAILGDAGLALFTAILAVGGMVFVWRTLEPANSLLRAFVVVLASATAAVFWSPRPHMFSFLLSAVVYYLLWRYLEQDDDRLWFIPPIMLLWANLHGGYAIGFVLIVLALLGEGLRWLFEDVLGGADDLRAGLRPLLRLIVVALVSVAATVINPYGVQMLALPFKTVGIGVLQDFIQEWASPDFHQGQTWPFIWMLLGTLALAGLTKKRLGWRAAIMVTGTAYMSLLAGRNISLFAVVAAPTLAVHAQSWLDELGVRLHLTRPPRGALLWANVAIILLGVIGVWVKGARALDPGFIAAAREERLPVRAVAYLQDERPEGPLFNSYNWGGYLTWALREYPVYVDGRTDLYDDELLRRFLSIVFLQPGWEEKLATTETNLVLIEANSPLAQALAMHDDWEALYADELAVIYARR